jgi:hypothetical protein
MDPYIDIKNLEHDPTLAQALGNMTVAWAHAETALVMTLSRITGISRNRAAGAYYRIPTFESRIKFIRALLTSWDGAGFDKHAIDRAVLKLSGLSRARNHWIHGVWSKSQTKPEIETVVFDFRSEDDAPDRRKPVKAADVSNHVQAVNRRADDLYGLVQHQRIAVKTAEISSRSRLSPNESGQRHK